MICEFYRMKLKKIGDLWEFLNINIKCDVLKLLQAIKVSYTREVSCVSRI